MGIMPLSKKYYEELAYVLGNPNIKTKGQVINRLARFLKEDNPRFNREKFVKAIAMHHSEMKRERPIRIGGKEFEI